MLPYIKYIWFQIFFIIHVAILITGVWPVLIPGACSGDY